MATANQQTQSQSAFVAILPREVRDLIYLELWRSSGLRQHIVFHYESNGSHFCRWSCTTEYDVRDKLQADIEAEIPFCRHLGGNFRSARESGHRLLSPWMNHWACGEDAAEACGIQAVNGMTTSAVSTCWKPPSGSESAGPVLTSSYLSMLLSCKLIFSSAECLKSIYESTTFVFTDTYALQHFFGISCGHVPEHVLEWPKQMLSPPGFIRYARHVELSLPASFSVEVFCASPDVNEDIHSRQEHDAYDFHWLRLYRFQTLRNLKIWIEARGVFAPDDCEDYLEVTSRLDADAIRNRILLSGSFGAVPGLAVTLSMPLGKDITLPAPTRPDNDDHPEGQGEGYVEEGLLLPQQHSNVRLWKRDTGDQFHPWLSAIGLIPRNSQTDGVIHASQRRSVRVSRRYRSTDLIYYGD
ncbi:hypothetical protein B0H66DRAFT_305904 [Apodospora peruviana]|uniref:Uncharacterized protein n=1 Tax=Apodospora peruviana TaxID=516989 RepID=A0AAE0M2X2_9PEZI|nr:hypothetical protein B0H66DRAFT_305904 [Apodospora peruviana]